MFASIAPRRRARIATAVAVLGVAAVALTACSSTDSSSPESTSSTSATAADYGDINIQLSWLKNTEFVGEYLAIDNGYFSDAGFGDVTLTAGGSSAVSAEAAITTGQALIGISGAVQAASAISEGAPVKIIATTYQKNPFDVMSLADNPISTPADLVGKTIAVSDSNSGVFQAYLTINDISPDDVTVVPFTGIDQLTTGQVDGYLGYTTSGVYGLKTAGFDGAELLLADSGLALISESIVATDDDIANHADELEAALTAIIKGWKDALADPEASTKLAVDVYGKDNNYDYDQQLNAFTVQAGLIQTDETDANGLLTMSDDLMDANISSLAAVGIDISKDDLFDTSIIDAVYAANPDLK